MSEPDSKARRWYAGFEEEHRVTAWYFDKEIARTMITAYRRSSGRTKGFSIVGKDFSTPPADNELEEL